MVLNSLLIIFLCIIVLGLIESYFHNISLNNIPIRIHINGSRGKSSVTRLIAAGLRAGGMKTLAKTTGTSPRIIDEDGNDKAIYRLRSASIGEQVRLIRDFAKKKPDVVVIECMAVNPQYQWVSEHKMIKSTMSVITNVRPDHLDEMGLTLKENANSLANTIPFNGNLITLNENDEINKIFEVIAKKRNTKLHSLNQNDELKDIMGQFKYLEHEDNVNIALKVCDVFGIKKEEAIKGMIQAKPDPGATVIWRLNYKVFSNYFINLLAANDPSSTYKIYQTILKRFDNAKICIFFNTRADRRYRTNQLLDLIFQKIKPDRLIIRGDYFPKIFKAYKAKFSSIEIVEIGYEATFKQVVKEFSMLDEYYIVGMGNIVGWGEKFIKYLKQYRT
mgnify:CR=1 FL=1|tara:strand:- start:228 stop:1394 length:1167 start_codon:yes stop_codon:yes gene_type:complete